MISLMAIAMAGLAGAAAPEPTWLERVQAQKQPYICNYFWLGGLNEALTEELIQDYRRMGFTGVQKEDFPLEGGRLFRQRGLHGWMWQTYWPMPDPVLDEKGDKPITHHWLYGCLSSEANMAEGVKAILRQIREYKDGVYQIDGKTVFSSWDETGLQYRTLCYCPHCHKALQGYVRERFASLEAARSALKTDWKSWDDVRVLPLAERFQQPLFWKVVLDWRAWQTFEFFRRIEAGVNAAGEPFAFMSFTHSSQAWPGPAHIQGLNFRLHARQSPVLVNECCIADFPLTTICMAWTDRLSAEYQKPVYNYSWFWPGNRGEGFQGIWLQPADEMDRALGRIMGHTLHGLMFWTYVLKSFRWAPEQSATIAYWHHFLQKHWDFLKAAPALKPQIVIAFPTYSAYFYPRWGYPKQGFGWTAQALIEAQYPFTILQDEEIEEGKLSDYRVLYAVGQERITPAMDQAIRRFVAAGGYVLADADSLHMTIDGSRTTLLDEVFGVHLEKKYKCRFYPTLQSAAEAAWADSLAQPEARPLACPDRTPTGLVQSELDREACHALDLPSPLAPNGKVRTHHDICTGRVTHGRPMGTFRGETAAVETDRTVWYGSRPGFDVYAVYPEDVLREWGEPLYPYRRSATTRAADRAVYRRLLTRIAEKAGVERPLTVTREGRLAAHVEVAVRRHAPTGTLMAFLINHEPIGGPHELTTDLIEKGWVAWDLTRNGRIEADTDGRCSLDLRPGRAHVVVFGPAAPVAQLAAVQAEVLAMDFKPRPFTVGPKTLNEPPLPVPTATAEPTPVRLEPGQVARVTVTVTNPLPVARAAEPIVLPAHLVAPHVAGAPVASARLTDGSPAQIDDLDEARGFSSGDEIVWLADLQPQETRTFQVILSARASEGPADKAFALRAGKDRATFVVEGKPVFEVTASNRWVWPQAQFPPRTPPRIIEQPGAQFFGADPTDASLTVLADGPVRKVVRAVHGYLKPAPRTQTQPATPPEKLPVTTTGRYAVYARQPAGRCLVWVSIEHHVTGEVVFEPDGWRNWPGGTYVRFFRRDGVFKDTLGRLSPLRTWTEPMELNFGGWALVEHGQGSQVAVLVPRTSGLVRVPGLADEADGIQIQAGDLGRAATSINSPEAYQSADLRVLAGNRFVLDLVLDWRAGATPADVEAARQLVASPPGRVVTGLEVTPD